MKKILTTYEKYLASMNAEERKEFDRELRTMALSEMIYAAMEEDALSVRKLAKIAGVSPSIVQDMRSGKRDEFTIKSMLKILHSLGFTVLLERNGETTPLDVSWIV